MSQASLTQASYVAQPGKVEQHWWLVDAANKVTRVEPFLTGWVKDNAYLGRPVDVLVMADGSLLVSDDHAGAVYRVSYAK